MANMAIRDHTTRLLKDVPPGQKVINQTFPFIIIARFPLVEYYYILIAF